MLHYPPAAPSSNTGSTEKGLVRTAAVANKRNLGNDSSAVRQPPVSDRELQQGQLGRPACCGQPGQPPPRVAAGRYEGGRRVSRAGCAARTGALLSITGPAASALTAARAGPATAHRPPPPFPRPQHGAFRGSSAGHRAGQRGAARLSPPLQGVRCWLCCAR